MRRLKVESTTDSELAQSCAELLQPYNLREVTVTVAAQPQVREDGAIERVEPTVETSSAVVPGEELRQNMMSYTRELKEYKRDHPDFGKYADPDAPLPLAARDEILRQRNRIQITEFLGFCSDVPDALCKLDPLEAARRTQDMDDDLDLGRMPDDSMDYETFRDLRNRQEASRPHKPPKR